MTVAAQVWVDYNDIDEHGRVLTLRKFFGPGARVEVGERLVTGDDEGNTCLGTVVKVRENGLVAIDLDHQTFVASRGQDPAHR
jgi:hypothetical protein